MSEGSVVKQLHCSYTDKFLDYIFVSERIKKKNFLKCIFMSGAYIYVQKLCVTVLNIC
jgi:hypothetical protein